MLNNWIMSQNWQKTAILIALALVQFFFSLREMFLAGHLTANWQRELCWATLVAWSSAAAAAVQSGSIPPPRCTTVPTSSIPPPPLYYSTDWFNPTPHLPPQYNGYLAIWFNPTPTLDKIQIFSTVLWLRIMRRSRVVSEGDCNRIFFISFTAFVKFNVK